MQSLLTVVTPSDTYDLTVLDNVKAELDIKQSDRSQDGKLRLYIKQASGAIADHCKRIFALETLSEQFRITHQYGHNDYFLRPRELILQRRPVTQITSVTENSVALVEGTDFEADFEAGLMWRLSGNCRRSWSGPTIIADYSAGYQLLGTLPWSIERACILLVKFYYAKAQRDPLLRGEEVIGVQRFDYQVNQMGDDGGLPPDVLSLLQTHIEPRVA